MKLTLAMGLLLALLISGIAVLAKSISNTEYVSSTQVSELNEQLLNAVALSKKAAEVPIAVEAFEGIAAMEQQLSDIRYNYIFASLALIADNETLANDQISALIPELTDWINKYSSDPESDLKLILESLDYMKLYGEKMFDSFISNATGQGTSMANGLQTQSNIISDLLNKLGANAKAELTSSVGTMIEATEQTRLSTEKTVAGSQAIQTDMSALSKLLTITGIIVILSTAGISAYISKLLKTATDQVIKTVSQISSNKDLTMRINRQNKDELGHIAHDFDAMMASFSEIVSRVRIVSDDLNNETHDMSKQVAELNSLLIEQQEAIDNISAAITEMSSSADEVAQNVVATADTARDAVVIGDEGVNIVNQTVQTITLLNDHLNETGESINELVLDIKGISEVLSIIQAIQEQTNLLALNAAIEAARAGEQGRGFAVVADEVRSLASKTKTSVESIAQTINRLQARSGVVVDKTQEAHQSAEKSMEQARQTGLSIEKIGNAIRDIMNKADVIAVAANQQTATSHDIATQIHRVSESATNIAVHANDNKRSGENVSKHANELKQTVAIFKV
ncbi:methyl-accepting chemotaxis protein [Reinekea sp.]